MASEDDEHDPVSAGSKEADCLEKFAAALARLHAANGEEHRPILRSNGVAQP